MTNNTISFMTANFVAREVGYRMTDGWMQGDSATQAFFQPEHTFAERFAAMLQEITSLGFRAIDLWTAHLNPAWATERQIGEAKQILEKQGLSIASLAAYFPEDLATVDSVCKFARSLGIKIVGGGCAPGLLAEKRSQFIEILARHDILFGYENHPEKSPDEVLAKIGPDDCDGRIGVALDTGWFGTQGYDAAKATRALAPRLLHMHLKDILKPETGTGPTLKDIGHETCALGEGVVPVEACVAVLKEIGYTGGISIEHEPEDHSPIKDVARSATRLDSWLGKAS